MKGIFNWTPQKCLFTCIVSTFEPFHAIMNGGREWCLSKVMVAKA